MPDEITKILEQFGGSFQAEFNYDDRQWLVTVAAQSGPEGGIAPVKMTAKGNDLAQLIQDITQALVAERGEGIVN